MGKKQDTTTQEGMAGGNAATPPSFVDDLLKNGTATLKAASPEALGELLATIPEDVKFSVGPIGKSKEDFQYSIRIDLINE